MARFSGPALCDMALCDVLLDEESKVAEDYNIIGVPTFFFVCVGGGLK